MTVGNLTGYQGLFYLLNKPSGDPMIGICTCICKIGKTELVVGGGFVVKSGHFI